MSKTAPQGDAVRIVRNIAVPVQMVYDAFIDPETLLRWMGPEGYRATKVEVDPRIGGTCDIWIVDEQGDAGSFHWEFVEMVPPELLVFSFAFGGFGQEVDTHRSRMTLEFREEGPDETELTLLHERLGAAPPGGHVGVNTGWTQALGKLADYLEGDRAESP